MRSRHIAAGMFVVLLMFAAACGDDDGGAESSASRNDTQSSGASEDDGGGDDFFEGKTLKIVVGTDPGGGFDTYARGIAAHMPAHIPGNPNIIVENMPGAGQMIAMNHVASAAPKDGTVIGTADGGLVLKQLVGAEGVEFDMAEMHYLGMPDDPVNMVLVARADVGVESLEDIIDGGEELVIGGQAPGDIQTDPSTLLREVLGANVDIILGYGGTGPLSLAMEQGEIDAYWGSLETFQAQFSDKLESGEWIVLTSLLEERSEDLPDVPVIYEFADDEDAQLLRVGTTYRLYVRPYFLPAEVPEERVEILREAFAQTMQDPAFLEEMEAAERTIGPVSGEDLEEIYTSFLSETSPEIVEELKVLLGL